MNFYKHHIGDYDAATLHLSWDEDQAYSRLLRIYYRDEKPIPADTGEACRLVRARTSSQRCAVQNVLHEFFELRDDGWHNKRADEEIVSYQAQASTNRRIARQRFVNDSSTNLQPNQNQIPEPDTRRKKRTAFVLPAWVPQEPWEAWLEVRKKNHAPNTERALSLAVNELRRLRDAEGQDPKAVLELATMRGWRGLFPTKGSQPNQAGEII